MRYWLMKTEPEEFSFDDLLRSRGKTTLWEGVRNYQARNFMRDEMKPGDLAFIYHSSCAIPAIVGIVEIKQAALADLSALDPKSPYYDEKSAKHGESRWCVVEVLAHKRFDKEIPLTRLKELKNLDGMLLLQRGQRLSVQPVKKEHWEAICQLEQLFTV